jgi:hypothetical protein
MGMSNFWEFFFRYASWLSAATAYHLPSSRSVGVSMRMNPPFLLTTFAASVLFLLVFHSTFEGLRYIFSSEIQKWPEKWTILKRIWTILKLSAVSPGEAVGISIYISCCRSFPFIICKLWILFHTLKGVSVASCVFLRHCRERPLAKRSFKQVRLQPLKNPLNMYVCGGIYENLAATWP